MSERPISRLIWWKKFFNGQICEITQPVITRSQLKELRNYKQKLFLCPPQNRRKHNQHFKTAVFYNKFTLRHIKPTSSLRHIKTKFASLKQYLFCLLTSRNAKKTQTDQSMSQVFLLCMKRNDPQASKSGNCKQSLLQCVCYCYNLLRWIFFILCDN